MMQTGHLTNQPVLVTGFVVTLPTESQSYEKITALPIPFANLCGCR